MSIVFRIATAVFVAATAASAQTPAPFPEFSAKRIKPPQPGETKRIDVQIDPSEPAAVPTPADTQPVDHSNPATIPDAYTWFWDKVSPELANSGPGRLGDALLAIRAEGAVQAPRLQLMQDIAKTHGVPILVSTVGTNVSPALVLAVIAVESSGRSDAVSGAGAEGLMQLMPDTAERFDVLDSFLAEENIRGGVRYLDWLLEEFDNDPILALAGYNAGEGAVRGHGGVPPFDETRGYVPKVLAAFDVARGLCATPPELISDGCVFVTMSQ